MLRELPPEENSLPQLFLPATDSLGTTPDSISGDSKSGIAAARTNGDSFTCRGTGSFRSIEIRITTNASKSHVGYIVDASSDSYQDMAILDDLTSLSAGSYTVNAACTDYHKSPPRSGLTMASVPWTEDSQSHWAYWVRQVAIRGRSDGRAQSEIQGAIWYITDRQGTYSSFPLLAAVGYSRNGPSKNSSTSSSTPGGQTTPSTCGACGAGLPLFGLLMMTWLAATRMRQRRRSV